MSLKITLILLFLIFQRQSKRKMPKEQETVENGEKEKQPRKQQGVKYYESSDSEEDALEKV